MSQNRIILGVDVSTTCTGVSILSTDGDNNKVLYIDRVKFKNSKDFVGTDSLFFKSRQFITLFLNKFKDIGITDVVIEEPLANSQNHNTVNTLMKFNGMLSQSIFEAIGVMPKYISSYDARRFAFPDLNAVRKYNKKGDAYPKKKVLSALGNNEVVPFGAYPFDCKKKHILWNKVSELYPDIQWVYDKKGELKTDNFDASDSLVCILGYLNREKYNGTSPQVSNVREDVVETTNKKISIVSYDLSFCEQTMKKTIEFIETT